MSPRKKNTDNDNKARIAQLLAMAWNTPSQARIISIANQILEIEPGSVEALLLKADNTKDHTERSKLLLQALSSVNEPENYKANERDLLTIAVKQRLAYTFFAVDDYDRAFAYCETVLKSIEENADLSEDEGLEDMKALYYRILIERKDWQRILSDTMKDDDKTLAWAYARLVAVWVMAAPEKRCSVCANLFWDALLMSPDVPFYILGLFEEPDDNADPEVLSQFDFALMYYDVISVTDEFYNWFSRGVILFGLLSGRFDENEYDYMLDALDNLGGFNDYQRMKNIITSTEDTEVIETLAANKCLTN